MTHTAPELPLVLASGSPRRKELLEQIGLTFRVQPTNVREDLSPKLTPEARVRALAWLKAREGSAGAGDAIVLGADTIVVLGRRVFGKPRTRADAAKTLVALSGRTHRVLTGVALFHPASGRQLVEVAQTLVTFRRLSRAEIDAYVRTAEPMDKAGAYAAQGRAATFVSRIAGDFYNVVGLPLARVVVMLEKFQGEVRRRTARPSRNPRERSRD